MLYVNSNGILIDYKLYFRWSATPPQERSRIMIKIADRLESQLQKFAEQESHDQGKPIWLAKAIDIPRAVQNLRCFATSILHDINKYVRSFDILVKKVYIYLQSSCEGTHVLSVHWKIKIISLSMLILQVHTIKSRYILLGYKVFFHIMCLQ